MDDMISRRAAIDAVDSETVSTNPENFKSSEKFIKFMDDADIASFGKWQWANGFNTALVATTIQLKKLPSAQPTGTKTVQVEDCISRAAVVALVEEVESKRLKGEIDLTYAPMIKGIKALPSAQPDVPDTNVGDMISRQAAIEVMRKAKDKSEAHRMLVQLPSAQPSATDTNVPTKQPGWIPVTERLPENGYWLWSANGGVVKKDFYWDGHWELTKKYGYEVVAWMPLPKPYREGGQDGEG